MLKIKLLPVFIFSYILSSFSQTPTLSGKLKDAETKQPLSGATIKIVSIKDSASVITDKNGDFEFKYINPGTYNMFITFLGYEILKKNVQWDNATKKLGDILINKEAKTLSGVTVVSTPPVVKQKADTTEINASQLKVNPDANSEDLIKKAPGITVESGVVKVGGEQVRKVTVDGRDFFGDDATATLRNLPAEIVDKIQVFDRMSDQAQFTGVDDGSAAKSINIVTKPNMRNGNFGRVFAGYGYGFKEELKSNGNSHYLVGGNMSYFKNNRRISIVGLSNDINQQNFAEVDLVGATGSTGGMGGFGGQGGGRMGGGGFGGGGGGRGFGGDGGGGFLIGQQPGISKTNSIGLNYNDKWGKKLDVSGSYFFNNRATKNNETITREYFLPGDSSQYYDQESISSNNNYNHRANFRFDLKLDSFNSILITPSVSFQKYESNSILNGLNYYNESNLISRTINKSNSNRNAVNFNNNILFRHSFKKRSRTISLNIGTRINNQEGEVYTDSKSLYYKGALLNRADSSYQFNDQLTKGYNISTSLNYTEPIGKKGAILEFRYNPSYQFNQSDKKTFFKDNATGKYSDFDTSLSSVFDNPYIRQRGGISYRKGDRTRQISFGLDIQSATLESNQVFPLATKVKKTFTNLLPSAMINLPLSKKESIRIFYRASTQEPNVNQLQEVINNTNPLLISTGNPDLKQEYSNMLGGRYQYTNVAKSNTIMVNFWGSAASNYVATASYIAKSDSVLTPSVTLYKGSQLTKPVNLDGQMRLNTFVTYARPLKFIKTNLNLNAGFTYNRTPGMINYEEGLTKAYNFNSGVVLASNISQYVDFTVSYSANFNNAKNSLQPAQDNKYFMSSTGIKLNLLSKNGWVFNSDVTNQAYSGLSDGFNQSYWLWNMAVAKKLFKKQLGEIRLSVFDLLDQNQSIVRTVSETYLEDKNTLVVKQYFMLTFTYNLKNFGKAPARPNNNQNRWDEFRRF